MKRILLFLFLCPLYSVFAQNTSFNNDSIKLSGIFVLDGFYEKPITNAHVSVYEADSMTLLYDTLPKRHNSRAYGEIMLPLRDKYLFKVEAKGYNTVWVSQKVKKTWYGKYPKYFVANDVRLYEEIKYDLSEATVKASRIQFVMKGDTIEYNAAAFRMSQGSMLDNLIRALPGATLDDNGQIRVNGKLVSCLTVNGRDFFRGDPKIALSNLPAYAVNKIRVFHKSPYTDSKKEDSRSQAEKENDPLIMDVALKREYAQGWISNYEVAGGSNLQGGWDSKWLGRMFAMRYTNHSSIAIYANANNLNESSNPGGKGEWRKTDPSAGEKKTYMGGMNFSIYPKNERIRFNTSLQVLRQETFNSTKEAVESFYNDGNVFTNSISNSKYTKTDLRWNSDMFVKTNFVNITLTPSVYYTHNKERGVDTSSQMQTITAPTALDTLYSRNRYSHRREDKWGVSIGANDYLGLQLGESGRIGYNFSFSYNKTTDKNTWSDAVRYKWNDANDYEVMKEANRPTFDYRYDLSATYYSPYLFRNENRRLMFFLNYSFAQDFNSGHQDLMYNNNLLTPSNSDGIEWTLDQQNSYHTTRLVRTNNIGPILYFNWKRFNLTLNSDLQLYRRRISDYRNAENKEYEKADFIFNPSLLLALGSIVNGEGQKFEITGNVRNTLPNLNYLLDVRDETDPMVRYYGNSSLKPERTYNANIGYYYQRWKPTRRTYSIGASYSKMDNSVSRARFYDNHTGVTTYKPQNINGNWQTSAFWSVQIGDMPKGLEWNYNASLQYQHSNEYATEGTSAQQILSVNSLIQEHKLRLSYRIKNVTIAGKAEVNWVQMRSEQHTFNKFSYTDFNYGISFSSPIVCGIDFDTDLMVYCRRGYNETSMNTTNWVWNASLSKALGKRKQWIIKANGFDLLHQISTIRRTVNAQGRIETWYNTMPSYATLHIVYRLDVKPKKK